ncbi:hypothetical protein ACFL6Y_06745 [Elusimicrobiota bacterium]
MAGPSEPTLRRDSGKLPEQKEGSRRRWPINLPFLKGKGQEGGIFSVSPKELAFLGGLVTLLFGGMGAVRMFTPNDAPVDLAPFSDYLPQEDLDAAGFGSRPPGGGEPVEEIVTAHTGRDTTRLVQPPGGMKKNKKPAATSAKDNTRAGLWKGLREAENRGHPRAPSLAGSLGALNRFLSGIPRGSSTMSPPALSPQQIADRIRSVSPTPSRGSGGKRLGYSGAQKAPGVGGGRRWKEQSSPDKHGEMGKAAAKAMKNLYGPAEQMMAGAGAHFGESKGTGEPGGVSMNPNDSTGAGDSPPAKVEYNLPPAQRDPIADDWAKKMNELKFSIYKTIADSIMDVLIGKSGQWSERWEVDGVPFDTWSTAHGCDTGGLDIARVRKAKTDDPKVCKVEFQTIYKWEEEGNQGGDDNKTGKQERNPFQQCEDTVPCSTAVGYEWYQKPGRGVMGGIGQWASRRIADPLGGWKPTDAAPSDDTKTEEPDDEVDLEVPDDHSLTDE